MKWEDEVQEYDNEMNLEFDSCSKNESFARMVISAFAAQLDPTLEELADIKTAVSEAVTNAVIHGYENGKGKIRIRAWITQNILITEIIDTGIGIADIGKAMEPFYTSKPEQERSGMGFSFMSAFMDTLEVRSEPGKGTSIKMKKKIT